MSVDAVINVSALIAGFGMMMLYFRIERELKMRERGEPIWIPWADWLLISASVISLTAVILPLLLLDQHVASYLVEITKLACSISILFVVGYFFSILTHYRLIWGGGRKGPRQNPEPSEKVVIIITYIFAIMMSVMKIIKLIHLYK